MPTCCRLERRVCPQAAVDAPACGHCVRTMRACACANSSASARCRDRKRVQSVTIYPGRNLSHNLSSPGAWNFVGWWLRCVLLSLHTHNTYKVVCVCACVPECECVSARLYFGKTDRMSTCVCVWESVYLATMTNGFRVQDQQLSQPSAHMTSMCTRV